MGAPFVVLKTSAHAVRPFRGSITRPHTRCLRFAVTVTRPPRKIRSRLLSKHYKPDPLLCTKLEPSDRKALFLIR